jgi:Zn/Cd-binding protein ZinT
MKLYAFKPDGHGEVSFFTIAKNKYEAKKTVDKYVEDNYVKDGKLSYSAGGWGTCYYTLTVVEEGNVIENDNS